MFPNAMKTMHDYQEFHKWMDEERGWSKDLLLNMVLLTTEVGEVAEEVKKIVWRTSLLKDEMGEEAARAAAEAEYREALGAELADCLAYIFKMANNTGIDLEQAYLAKMTRNVQRQWTGPPPGKPQG